jgi:hypothetical protein
MRNEELGIRNLELPSHRRVEISDFGFRISEFQAYFLRSFRATTHISKLITHNLGSAQVLR